LSELIANIFERAVPIRFEDHRQLRFSARHDYRFAAGLNAVPLAYTEWVSAARHYPVVFSTNASGTPDSASVLLKIAPQAEDPFIRPEDGQWLPDHYIPQYLRFYPFMLDSTSPTHPVLMAVLDAPHFSDSVGEPLFDDSGEMAPWLQKRFEDLQTYRENISRTHSLVDLLHGEGLLSLSQVFRTDDPGHAKLIDVVSVDQDKLSNKPPEALAQLGRRGILPLIYAQMHSLQNLDRLDRASRAPAARTKQQTVAPPASMQPVEEAPAAGQRMQHRLPAAWLVAGIVSAFLLGSWLGPDWNSEHPAEDLAALPPSMVPSDPQATTASEPPAPTLPESEATPAVPTTDASEATTVDRLPTATSATAGIAELQTAVPQPPAQAVDQTEDSRADASGITEAHSMPGVLSDSATPSLQAEAGEATVIAAAPQTDAPPLARPIDQVEGSQPDASSLTETQTELEVVTEPAAPPLPPAVRDEIDSLLTRIQVNIQRDRLSRPADDNAIDMINRIFALDPDNVDATAALNDVIDRYITLARKNPRTRGKTHLQAAHRLDPARLDIDNAWRDLYAPEEPAWYRDN